MTTDYGVDRDDRSAIDTVDPHFRFSERPGYPYHGLESGGRLPWLIDGVIDGTVSIVAHSANRLSRGSANDAEIRSHSVRLDSSTMNSHQSSGQLIDEAPHAPICIAYFVKVRTEKTRGLSTHF
ncbi:MAG: hypothetical protein HC795_12825 [Coleofasciculaceae cyanobacterium RL_1_1]|nr:hypothetical protein [Coleofasciculaceae cyanobacterium RL_1_1]